MAVLTLLVTGLWLSPTPAIQPAGTQVEPLVHFQDASHDWLMVVDPVTHELVVYDANDGRPLHRLGASEGLSRVTAISRQGSLLFVTGGRRGDVQVLSLPQLQAVALNGR